MTRKDGTVAEVGPSCIRYRFVEHRAILYDQEPMLLPASDNQTIALFGLLSQPLVTSSVCDTPLEPIFFLTCRYIPLAS